MENDIKYFNYLLTRSRNIYLLGIGGVSMSALAQIYSHLGYNIIGSDKSAGRYFKTLENLGFDLRIGEDCDRIKNCDILVYSNAISDDDPNLVFARENNIPSFDRSYLLGALSYYYTNTISVAGTHGKTTTTALISHILGKYNPTCHIGGRIRDIDTNCILGDKKYFVTEACEYKRGFQFLNNYISVITSIESEHMDYYSDLTEVYSAYQDFAKDSKYIIVYKNCPLEFSKESRVFTFGFDDSCTIYASNLILEKDGTYSFDCYFDACYLGRFRSTLCGKYNISNILVMVLVGLIVGMNVSEIMTRLLSFPGVARRDEMIGNINGVPIICDYAHIPHAINLKIEEIKDRFIRPLVVFEPHTYSRTKTHFCEFVSVLNKCHDLVILPTYPARENLILGYDSVSLYNKILKKYTNKYYLSSFKELTDFLNQNVSKYDCVLILGAGATYDYLVDYLDKN